MTRVRPHSAAMILVAAVLVLAACDTGYQSSEAGGNVKLTYLDKSSIPKDPAEQVFQQVCLSCHATGVGPVITGRNLPPDAVKLFVRNGSRAMPAFTQAMIDDETLDRVAQLVAASEAPTSQSVQ